MNVPLWGLSAECLPQQAHCTRGLTDRLRVLTCDCVPSSRQVERWRSRSRVACFVAEDAQGALAGCAFLSFTKPEVCRL